MQLLFTNLLAWTFLGKSKFKSVVNQQLILVELEPNSIPQFMMHLLQIVVTLFDGTARHLRPPCSAEARASGLFRVLGIMLGHSLLQSGMGFPYLAPQCYWYVVGREEQALENLSVEDLNADVGALVKKVCYVIVFAY